MRQTFLNLVNLWRDNKYQIQTKCYSTLQVHFYASKQDHGSKSLLKPGGVVLRTKGQCGGSKACLESWGLI